MTLSLNHIRHGCSLRHIRMFYLLSKLQELSLVWLKKILEQDMVWFLVSNNQMSPHLNFVPVLQIHTGNILVKIPVWPGCYEHDLQLIWLHSLSGILWLYTRKPF